MKKIVAFLLSFIAVMFAFPALAAGLGTKTLYQNGAITIVSSVAQKEAIAATQSKLTTMDTRDCVAINAGARVIDPPSAEPTSVKYVFAVPAWCLTSSNTNIWIDAPLEQFYPIGTADVFTFFEGIPMAGIILTPPRFGYVRKNDIVEVSASRKLEMKFGNDVITAYTDDTMLWTSIAGTINNNEGGRTSRTCRTTGCTVGSNGLPWGMVTLYPALMAVSGSAMVGADGSTVGAYIGTVEGISTGATVDAIRSDARTLGINLDGKG